MFRMQKERVIIFLFLMVNLATSSYALQLSTWWQNKTWQPVVAVGGGTATTSSAVGQSKRFPILNPMTDQFFNYSAYHFTQTSGLFDVFLGAEWHVQSNWLVQAGIDYNQATPFTAKGTFVQGADLESADGYAYHYEALIKQVLMEGKLLYTFKNHYHPYVLAGIGAAFNKAYHYYTTVPPDLTFTRMYANDSATSVSYALGLGVDMDVTPQFRLGLGYRFADKGEVRLGRALISTTSASGTLSQSHFYTNEVIAQLTWIIGA